MGDEEAGWDGRQLAHLSCRCLAIDSYPSALWEAYCATRLVHGVGVEMGFFSRLLVPRSVRRAMHPGSAVKRAVTPKVVKRVSRALHPPYSRRP